MRFLADNFFSVAQYSRHVIKTNASFQPGHEVFRVGTARRGSGNYYEGSFGLVDVQVDLDRVRLADMFVIDRNSILGEVDAAGAFKLQYSTDGGSNPVTITTEPPTTEVVLGSSLRDPPHYIRTDEGAVVIRFPEVAANWWQLSIVGGNSTRRIGGLTLGLSYEPNYPRLPWDDEQAWSAFGAVRQGLPDNDWRWGRAGVYNFLTDGDAETNEFRKFRELLKRGHPTWVFPDQDHVERCWMGYANAGVAAPVSEVPWGRSVSLSLEELDPARP